jgi:putative nucleotidyltransferase with HDIG domain
MTNLIPFLTRMMGLRDPHAESHSTRVTDYSSVLARKMKLSSSQIENLDLAARLHDIGKMAINEFVINKPGRFTEAEYLMVQHHSELGASLLVLLELDPSIPSVVLHHHENFDGSGYPHGIKGEEIPLEARILRITDTYDALISDRGYRPAYSKKKALIIMEKDSRFFDPQLLELFFRMHRHKKL